MKHTDLSDAKLCQVCLKSVKSKPVQKLMPNSKQTRKLHSNFKEKSKIRTEKIHKRDLLTSDQIENDSLLIQNKILESDIFAQASAIFCYIHIRSEVRSMFLIQEALRVGKTVAVPITLGHDKGMYFSRIHVQDLENLKPSLFGLLEPVRKEKIEPDNKTLFIIPGACYDLHGNRIGYGAGYYDRYLKDRQYMHLLGACFDMQLVESIEMEPFDIRMDSIVTEIRWIFSKVNI